MSEFHVITNRQVVKISRAVLKIVLAVEALAELLPEAKGEVKTPKARKPKAEKAPKDASQKTVAGAFKGLDS